MYNTQSGITIEDGVNKRENKNDNANVNTYIFISQFNEIFFTKNKFMTVHPASKMSVQKLSGTIFHFSFFII
jgi:hypothetical protein